MFNGSCFCGSVSFTLKSVPMFVHCCHCRDCQRQTGGAFAINALIERDLISFTEKSVQPVPVSLPTQSGRPHDVYRCPQCQTALWSDYGRRGVMVFVRVNTLDRAHDFEPDVHIFVRSKVPWVSLPDHARAFDVYYDMEREWPPESLARRKAVLGGRQ